jgi:hypothetical protein
MMNFGTPPGQWRMLCNDSLTIQGERVTNKRWGRNEGSMMEVRVQHARRTILNSFWRKNKWKYRLSGHLILRSQEFLFLQGTNAGKDQ